MANRLCQFVQMGHVKQLTKPIFHEMHPGVRIEVQKGEFLHRFLKKPHAVNPKTMDPVQSFNLKIHRLSFVRPFLT